MQANTGHIVAKDITIAYGDFVVQRDLNFTVNRGDIFIIMGGSGCGKSTLMKVMIGLKEPARGDIHYEDVPFWASGEDAREAMKRKFGTLFQSGALWSSMTLAENIGLALKQPSAGLDPISARLLDDLILELRDSLGTTVVVVTHELASLFAIGNNSVFLDASARTQLATGDPKELRDSHPNDIVRAFLRRGVPEADAA